MEKHLKMSSKERERLKIFKVERGELQQKEEAAMYDKRRVAALVPATLP